MTTAVAPAPLTTRPGLEEWEAAAAGIRSWWPAFESVMAPVTATMIGQARLRRGAGVVDVASGFGEPALAVARHLAPAGRVVTSDLSPALLAIAAERAGAMGLDNIDFLEMDAEEPTLPLAGFDAVLCRFGLMFLSRLDAALSRLTGLLVPTGRMVAAVWGRPDANPWLGPPLTALGRIVPVAPLPPAVPGVFGLSDPAVLEAAFAGAGLTAVSSTRVPLRWGWPSPADFIAFHRLGPMQRVVAGLPSHRRALVWHELAAAVERCWGGGPVRLPGEVLVVSGTR